MGQPSTTSSTTGRGSPISSALSSSSSSAPLVGRGDPIRQRVRRFLAVSTRSVASATRRPHHGSWPVRLAVWPIPATAFQAASRHDLDGDQRHPHRAAGERGLSRHFARDAATRPPGSSSPSAANMALGKPPEEAIEGVYIRTGVAGVRVFRGDARRADEGGRPPRRDAADARRNGARARRPGGARQGSGGEVIFSSRALSVSPLIVGGVLYSLSPSSVDLLFTDPVRHQTHDLCGVLGGHRNLVLRWMVRRETSL